MSYFSRLFLCLFSLFASLVQAQTTPDSAQLNCRIEPSVVVSVSSPVEGVIRDVLVDKNDQVEKGAVVATLASDLEAATVELRKLQSELNSDVEAKQLALDFSKRALDRVSNLADKKAASTAELDKVKTENAIATQELKAATDRKRQAGLEFKRAQADLQRRTILSPIKGVVIERFKQAGEHIDYDPVLKIAQLDPLKIEVFAPASVYGQIKVGMRATFEPDMAGPRKTYTAQVILVDPVIDGPSNTFGVRLSFPNPNQQLPSGLKCKINFSGVSVAASKTSAAQ